MVWRWSSDEERRQRRRRRRRQDGRRKSQTQTGRDRTTTKHKHKRIRPKKGHCEPKTKDDGRHAGQVVGRRNFAAWASRVSGDASTQQQWRGHCERQQVPGLLGKATSGVCRA
jgi:hypothetical protein